MNPRSVFLEDLTSPEIEFLIHKGWRQVILSSGSMEQQGPHMPLDVDTAVAREIARRLAHKLGHTLIAPIIPVGCSDYHMSFSGTLSVPIETFKSYQTHMAKSLIHHGFQTLLFTSFHGGNFKPSQEVAEALQLEYPQITVRTALNLDELFRVVKSTLDQQFPDRSPYDCHAACCITSLQSCINAERIRADKVENGVDLLRVPEITGDLRELSPNGVLGRVDGYGPEVGEALYTSLTEWTIECWQM